VSMRRALLALFSAGSLLVAGADTPAAAQGDAPGRTALSLHVRSWVFPGRPLPLTVDQAGVLAQRRLAVYLFVDQNQFERITTQGDRTQASVALPPLEPGKHVLMARSGTEVATAEFRVLPWSWLVWALLAALAGGALVLLGRRRRPASG